MSNEFGEVRRPLRTSRADKIRKGIVNQRVGVVAALSAGMESHQLIWFGQLSKMEVDWLLKQALLRYSSETRKIRTDLEISIRKAPSFRHLNENQIYNMQKNIDFI